MKLGTSVGLAFLSICLTGSSAQTGGVVKTWNFSRAHGSLHVVMRSTDGGSISLSLGPDHKVRVAPIAEQVEPLKQVLGDIMALGLDPRNLAYLGTRLFEEDVIEKLAYASADSHEWQLSMRNGGKGKEGLVVTLLNQSGAFAAYNEAFSTCGLRVRVTEAEKVGLMHFSHVPPRDSRDRANAQMLVPADAMVGMRFSLIKPDSAETEPRGE